MKKALELNLRRVTMLSILVLSVPSAGFAQEYQEEVAGGETMAPAPVSHAGGWDARFGGIPNKMFVTGDLGFSALPKLGIHMPMSPTFELGGAFAFDLGYYAPSAAVNAGLTFSAPLRLSISNANKLSMGLHLEPGFGMSFSGVFNFGILLNGGFNVGYAATPQLTVGGGMDLPMLLVVTNGAWFVIPILFGPVLEFHVTPELGLYFDSKFGPHISAGNFSGTTFGLKISAGVAYRI